MAPPELTIEVTDTLIVCKLCGTHFGEEGSAEGRPNKAYSHIVNHHAEQVAKLFLGLRIGFDINDLEKPNTADILMRDRKHE